MAHRMQIPDGWQMARLGDVAEVVMGQSPPGTTVFDWDDQSNNGSGLPFVQGNAEFNGRFPVPVKWCVKPAKIAKPGDVLISVRAPVGETNLADQPLGIGRGLAAIRFVRSDSAFGWHVLNDAKGAFERVSQGSTFDAIGSNELHSLPILLPPPSEQRAIAAVLDSIDEAIECTEAIITATEYLRDALLHELLRRGVPGWHTAWKEASGVGTIPACWKAVRLEDVAEVAFSSVDKKTLDDEIPVELCNYTDVFYNRRIRLGMEFMTATASPGERDQWALRRGDVLFTKDSETPEEIGIPSYVTADMPQVLCGYHLGLARPREERTDGAYLAELLRSPRTAGQFARIANGVTRFGLTLGATNSITIPLPSLSEQQVIATMLESVDYAIERVSGERDGLQSLKESAADTLLTGRVRVERENS